MAQLVRALVSYSVLIKLFTVWPSKGYVQAPHCLKIPTNSHNSREFESLRGQNGFFFWPFPPLFGCEFWGTTKYLYPDTLACSCTMLLVLLYASLLNLKTLSKMHSIPTPEKFVTIPSKEAPNKEPQNPQNLYSINQNN